MLVGPGSRDEGQAISASHKAIQHFFIQRLDRYRRHRHKTNHELILSGSLKFHLIFILIETIVTSLATKENDIV
jgi:hypothetical protein